MSELTDVEQVLNTCGTDVRNQKPETRNHKPIIKTKEKIPYQLIADSYNKNYADNVNGKGHILDLADDRKKAIARIWKFKPDQAEEKNSTNKILYWDRYFKYCSEQPKLNGGQASETFTWVAALDDLIKWKRYIKILEGEL